MELEPDWSYMADTVMGGNSSGSLVARKIGERSAARLTGTVSLDNNGGFIQMAFGLNWDGSDFDASGWLGIELDACGNEETYEIRLRTSDLTRPWQSFRAAFVAASCWSTCRFPFECFTPNRTDAALDPARLKRVGVLAAGRAFEADVAASAVRFCR